jgi:hypothetical protein
MKKIFNVIALLLIAISFGSCNSEMDKAEETKGYIQLTEEKTLVHAIGIAYNLDF